MSKLKAATGSLSFRTLLITFLGLAMLIPLSMTKSVIKDRQNYYNQSIDEIGNGWGSQQTIIGPVLVAPFTEHIFTADTVTDKNGETRTISRDVFNQKTMVLLPESLNYDVELNEQYRKRGIYSTLLYIADVTLSGSFDLSSLPSPDSSNKKIDWDEAYIAVGLSDTKAITETTPLRWNKSNSPLAPGTQNRNLLRTGFHASMKDLDQSSTNPEFRLKLSFKGSRGIRFAPLGKNTKATVQSAWPHPSFKGDVLPNKKAEVSEDGFKADWSIPHLARNYPQNWLLDEEKKTSPYNLYSFKAGVDLFTPISIYTKIDRSVKYGALFIGLTFVVFLLFELVTNTRPHIIQYILIGISLSLFYLMLISLSEHIPFLMAYTYSAAATIGIITLYSAAALKRFSRALMVFLLLSSLYTVLFFILQMQDYSLLAGTALVTLVVVVMMFATRGLETKE